MDEINPAWELVGRVRESPPSAAEQQRVGALVDGWLDAVRAQVPAPLADDAAWAGWLHRLAVPYIMRQVCHLPAQERDLVVRTLVHGALRAWHREEWGGGDDDAPTG